MHWLNSKELISLSLIFLLLAWAFYLLDSIHGRWVETRARLAVAEQLVRQGSALSDALGSKVALLYGIRGFVESNHRNPQLDRQFETIATTLRGNASSVRAIQLVQDGVITHMAPLKGNEAAIGHDILHDPRPAVAVSVRRAYESEHVTLNGPIELKQGGLGLVARLPIMDGKKVWGLAAVVINIPGLFSEAGMLSGDGTLKYAVRDRHHGVFFGEEEVFAQQPELQRIPLLDGYWELAAVPGTGWYAMAGEAVLTFRFAGGLIILLVMSLLCVSLRNKSMLRTLVDRRTQELAALNAELRREISSRRQTEIDLVAARDKAEHSDRLKDFFIATMSHEIRTPLHVILGYVDLLCGTGTAEGEEKEMYVDSMKNAGKRLMRTVEELLHISSLRAGTFTVNPEDFDVVESSRLLARQFHGMARERGLSLIFKSTLSKAIVYADRYSMEQAVSNLLDNAVKYTEQGEIELFLSGEGHDCTLSLRDTGIGISEEYLHQVFEVFSQEKTGYCRPYDGLGLGLALTKNFVELNNGRIHARSEKGKGSEFTLTFPTVSQVEHGVAEEETSTTHHLAAVPSLTLLNSVANVA
ncbi:MAG: CHASE domain-containing protein [Bacteroidetes bacterium]|nr:CHASE domain-containing protein [Bacteroidota bacterium]